MLLSIHHTFFCKFYIVCTSQLLKIWYQTSVEAWSTLIFCFFCKLVLSRLCIGHTNVTHSHLLKREDTSICSMGKAPFTVKYILLNCDSFRQTHLKYYLTSSLKDFFLNSTPGEILGFLLKKKKKFINN